MNTSRENSASKAASAMKLLRDHLYTSESDKTFQNDDNLPSLPLPPLSHTLQVYLDTVRAVAEDEQSYQNTVKIVNQFENGIGAQLHSLLEKKAQNSRNWLEEWWQEYAYLRYREPLLPKSNMSAPMRILPFLPPKSGTSIERLALNIYFTLEFWSILRNEKMRPMINKKTPWDMSQFRRIFNTTRIPGEEKDELICSFKTASEGPKASTEIIVLYHGFIYVVDFVIKDQSGKEFILTPVEIERQLRLVVKNCNQSNATGEKVGALTLSSRDDWHKNRLHLINLSDENKDNLNRIESALMVVSISDKQPKNTLELFNAILKEATSDRWADKSLTTIVYENGIFGANVDHTPIDGICAGIMSHYIIMSMEACTGVFDDVKKIEEEKMILEKSHIPFDGPRRLKFNLDDKLKEEISISLKEYEESAKSLNTAHMVFTDFGKSLLKKLRFHPEAFIQIALQVAYYRLHKKPASTYCTASTRQFYHGRTETCRSCFPESIEFAKALITDKKSPEILVDLLKKAVDKFMNVMKEATNGQGCDRHFLGLYLTCLENGFDLPELFTDPLFALSGGAGNYILSTSCLGYWSASGGVPPMKEDGYSCFYGIEDNAITLTSLTFINECGTDANKFIDNIKLSLNEMKEVISKSKL